MRQLLLWSLLLFSCLALAMRGTLAFVLPAKSMATSSFCRPPPRHFPTTTTRLLFPFIIHNKRRRRTAPATAVFASFPPEEEEEEEATTMEWDEDEEDLAKFQQLLEEQPPYTSSAFAKQGDEFWEKFHQTMMQGWLPVPPITQVYNYLLQVHATSPYARGAERAEAILWRMLGNNPTNTTTTTITDTLTVISIPTPVPSPDHTSFAHVMDAWMRRGRFDRVEEWFDQMRNENEPPQQQQRLLLQPNIDIYNKVIKARGMAGQAEKAQDLLDELLVHWSLSLQQKNPESDTVITTAIRPNQKTWVHVLRAYATPN